MRGSPFDNLSPSWKVDTISGTPGYACPIYARTGQVTEFSEAPAVDSIGACRWLLIPVGDHQVYSFGMVILEVLTAIPPAMADNTKPGGGHLRLNPQFEEVLHVLPVDRIATIAFAYMYNIPMFFCEWVGSRLGRLWTQA